MIGGPSAARQLTAPAAGSSHGVLNDEAPAHRVQSISRARRSNRELGRSSVSVIIPERCPKPSISMRQGTLYASLGSTRLDSDGELSERPRASALKTEARNSMSVLFAFAPFLTFVLLGIHLYQVGEVIPEHDHGSHH
jgi:hypothetical protein